MYTLYYGTETLLESRYTGKSFLYKYVAPKQTKNDFYMFKNIFSLASVFTKTTSKKHQENKEQTEGTYLNTNYYIYICIYIYNKK